MLQKYKLSFEEILNKLLALAPLGPGDGGIDALADAVPGTEDYAAV
mgnify:CR=1 FL=1